MHIWIGRWASLQQHDFTREVIFKHGGITVWPTMTLIRCGTLAYLSQRDTTHRHIRPSDECPILHGIPGKDSFPWSHFLAQAWCHDVVYAACASGKILHDSTSHHVKKNTENFSNIKQQKRFNSRSHCKLDYHNNHILQVSKLKKLITR